MRTQSSIAPSISWRIRENWQKSQGVSSCVLPSRLAHRRPTRTPCPQLVGVSFTHGDRWHLPGGRFCSESCRAAGSDQDASLTGLQHEAVFSDSVLKVHSPGQCAQLAAASPRGPKGRRFDSQSGHRTRLQVQSPLGSHARRHQSVFLSHTDVSLPLSPSFPLSKINEHVLR